MLNIIPWIINSFRNLLCYGLISFKCSHTIQCYFICQLGIGMVINEETLKNTGK